MKRTCANCCAYDAKWGCMNGAPITPDCCCDEHQTQAEFEADVQAIERFRVRIGLTPRRGWPGDEFTGVTP